MPREPIEPHEGDKRHVRLDDQGRSSEADDVGKAHAQDPEREAGGEAKRGEGDRGDREG